MKYKIIEDGNIVEAEQFLGLSLGYEEDGVIANGYYRPLDFEYGKCGKCGESYQDHLYLQYGETKLTVCRGDYVVYDPTVESYFGISEEDFERQAIRLESTTSLNPHKNEPFTHPLKNPNSSHYAMWHNGDGEAVEAIDLMEKMFTQDELLTWAKITVLKYRLRIGKKDDIAKEMKKIETYEAYVRYLENELSNDKLTLAQLKA